MAGENRCSSNIICNCKQGTCCMWMVDLSLQRWKKASRMCIASDWCDDGPCTNIDSFFLTVILRLSFLNHCLVLHVHWLNSIFWTQFDTHWFFSLQSVSTRFETSIGTFCIIFLFHLAIRYIWQLSKLLVPGSFHLNLIHTHVFIGWMQWIWKLCSLRRHCQVQCTWHMLPCGAGYVKGEWAQSTFHAKPVAFYL